jgi:serine/threonine-protein kinase RsbW
VGVTRLLPWADWARTLPPAAREAVGGFTTSTPYVYFKAPVLVRELATVRTKLRDWAETVRIDAEQTADILLAVDEAVANAVEHAYRMPTDEPGAVTVFACRIQPHSMTYVVVADGGKWKPPPADAGLRGRGVTMMRAVTDRFDLHHDETGTTVLLGWVSR